MAVQDDPRASILVPPALVKAREAAFDAARARLEELGYLERSTVDGEDVARITAAGMDAVDLLMLHLPSKRLLEVTLYVQRIERRGRR